MTHKGMTYKIKQEMTKLKTQAMTSWTIKSATTLIID